MPTGYLQEKFESTPGNEANSPTLSTKVMYPAVQEFTPDPGTQHLERDDELPGSEESRAIVTDSYRPTWSSNGRLYPDLAGWRLTHILGPPTTTAGDGVITDPDGVVIPAGAYRHVWDSTNANWGNAGVSPKTAQMYAVYKDQGEFIKIKGAGCASLSITNPEQGGVMLAASGPALYMDDAATDPAVTPAMENSTTQPFKRSGLSLPTWLTGTGTHEDFDVTIESPLEVISSLGVASKWADVLEKGEGLITITGSMSQRQLDPQDIAALRAATGFAIKAKWLNDSIITGSTKHALWLEGVNAQYTSGTPAALGNRRRIGGSFNWKLTTAGTGVQSKWTLVNGTSSYL